MTMEERYAIRWHMELIETLWNVNTRRIAVITTLSRINRNIVECKFTRNTIAAIINTRINRNIVECK